MTLISQPPKKASSNISHFKWLNFTFFTRVFSLLLILGALYQINTFFPQIFSYIARSAFAQTSNTFYVSPNGNDSNNGSISQPFKTISKALTSIQPGGTIILKGGQYKQKVTISKSGTPTQPLTLKSAPGESVSLDLGGSDGPVLKTSGNYINVSGFEVKNSIGTCVELSGTHINANNLNVHDCREHGISTDGQFITIENNTVTQTNSQNDRKKGSGSKNWGSAIKVRVNGDHVTIKRNTVHNNWGEGIALSRGANSVVTGNVVSDNYGVNIYVDNSHDIKVDNNFMYCTAGSNVKKDNKNAIGIALGEESYSGWGNQLARVELTNNQVLDCSRGLESFQPQQENGGLDAITIANNTFWNSPETSLSFTIGKKAGKNRNISIRNNVIQQSKGKLIWTDNVSGFSFSKNRWSVAPPAFAASAGDAIGTNNITPPNLSNFLKQFTGSSVPSPIPVPTPTKTPSPSPAPSAKPSPLPTQVPSPSPTPTPNPQQKNSVPYVGTVKLKSGKVGQPYAASITGYDQNQTDTLKLTAKSSLSTIGLTNCSTSIIKNMRQILCQFKGTPTRVGNFPIYFTVNDNKGASASQTVLLQIQ